MNFIKKGIILVVTVMVCISAFAESGTKEKDIATAVEYHNKARTAGIEYGEKALALLKPYCGTDSIASAYYGSTLTVIAGIISEKNPIKALEYLQSGGEYMDKAVEMNPENPVVHFVRLENGIEVSRTSPIKRYSVIKKDFVWFIDDDNISSLGIEDQAEAYLYCGHLKLDEGDLDYALELYESSVDAAPESNSAKISAKMLDKYTE